MDLSALANADLTKVPAIQAPAGYTSNLINPENDSYKVTICNVVCLVVICVFVGLRMFTRIHIVKAVGYDDYCCLLSLLFWLGTAAIFQCANYYGLGRHLWDCSLAEIYPRFMQLWVFGSMMYNITMLVTKMSILLLYRRLFPIGNFITRWWLVVLLTAGYSIGGIFASIFQCRPIAASWTLGIKADYCINVGQYYNANAALNIITLPIPIVWGLNLKLRQKLILSGLFVLGSLSCVVSMIRLMFIMRISNAKSNDLTRGLLGVVLSSQGELTAAIACACMPCLRPFFERYTPFLFSTQHGGYGNSSKSPYARTPNDRSRPDEQGTRSMRVPNSKRANTLDSGKTDMLEHDIELEPGLNPYKTDTEVSVVYAHSDNASTDDILQQHAEENAGERAIAVRKSYHVMTEVENV